MSDTPRTDATEKHAYQFDDDMTPVVDSKFARQLERELTEANTVNATLLTATFRELAEVTKERDHLKKLINNFCANQKWAAESWKAQKHVKPLFDIFIKDKSNE